MPRLPHLLFAALLAAAALPALRDGSAARAEPPGATAGPMPVLTDTVDYCNQLERQITARPNRPPDATRLLAEGHQMCDHGEVRQGVARLRRALAAMRRRAVMPMPR